MTGFWHRWMVIWCWTMIGVGALFAMSVLASLRAPTLLFLDIIFWPMDGQPAALSPVAMLGISLTGALTIGWGVLMLGLARDPQLSREPRVWQLMTYAMIIWFAVDSTASWLSGASVNVLSNVGFLVTFLIPIYKSGVFADNGLATGAV